MEQPSAAETPQARPEKQIPIRFPNGIYGFEDVREFLLLQEDEKQVIWSLQAASRPYPTIIVVDPALVMPGYAPKLPADALKALGNPAREDLCYLAVAVIRKKLEDSVVSLKSPIVINVKSRVGMQIVLEDGDYPLRCRLFAENGGR